MEYLTFECTCGERQAPGEISQRRALIAATKIDPIITFHFLCHIYASALAMLGVSIQVIDELRAHMDTRISHCRAGAVLRR